MSILGFAPDQQKSVAPQRNKRLMLIVFAVVAVLVITPVVGVSVWLIKKREAERVAAASVAMAALTNAIDKRHFEDVVTNLNDANRDITYRFASERKHPHNVSLDATTVDGNRATATLRHSWFVGKDLPKFTYQTELALEWRGDAWRTEWDSAFIMPPDSPENARLLIGLRPPKPSKVIGPDGTEFTADQATGVARLLRNAAAKSTGSTVVAFVDGDGNDLKVLHSYGGRDGQTVQVALNTALQAKAHRLLEPFSKGSAIVAIRPSDGHILASASGPGGPVASVANLGLFAPGSTFKTVTALAMLRSGLTPESVVQCPATVSVGGRSFKNYSAYPDSALGAIRLKTAFAQSCNTAFVSAAMRLPQGALADAAAALGMTVSPTTGVASTMGRVPAELTGAQLAASALGQGRVEASPLAMATVAASVAAGKPVRPQFVLNDASLAELVPDGLPKRPVSAGEAKALRGMMQHAVASGTGIALRGLPGAGAKTGTAQVAGGFEHAWMIAVKGDLAVAVFVANGGSGAKTAGPVMRKFLAGT